MTSRKTRQQDEALNQVSRAVLNSLKVSEDEIEAASGSPDLYGGLQMRIAAERGRRDGWRSLPDRSLLDFIHSLQRPRRSEGWTLIAAAVLLLVAIGLSLWLPRQSGRPTRVVGSVPLQVTPTPAPELDSKGPAGRLEKAAVAVPNAPRRPQRALRRQPPAGVPNDEIATDFFPLTFTADSTAAVSGHLVRVTVPRSALVAMGLPMNAERSGELVRADVFIGDDGLARAIRFIQ